MKLHRKDVKSLEFMFLCVSSGYIYSNSENGSCLINTDGQGESECLFPEDLWSRERTHLVFGAHFGVERGHKTMGNSMSDCIKQ